MPTTIPLADLLRYVEPGSKAADRLTAKYPDGLVCQETPSVQDVRMAVGFPIFALCDITLTRSARGRLRAARYEMEQDVNDIMSRLSYAVEQTRNGLEGWIGLLTRTKMELERCQRQETRLALALLSDPDNWISPQEVP